jgi:iron uptake system component EfeO
MPVRSLRRRSAATLAVVAALALVATGCSSDEGGSGGGGDGTVAVTLQEFSVNPAPASAPAGSVTFDVTNEGPNDVHEFVVFSTDLAPDALPTGADGSVDEAGEGLTLIDEIEDIAVGDAPTLTVNLDAGNYVLICNIYDATEDEAHYQEGMFVGFTVE